MTDTVEPYKSLDLPYRSSVGIMLINLSGLIWIGRRRERFSDQPNSWQMPQGGIDPDEPPAAAAYRELAEETGTAKAEILAESQNWLHYDLPAELIGFAFQGKYRGQKQKWFAMRFLGDDSDFNIHSPPGGHEPEFDAWRWARSEDILGLIIPFKRQVYQAVIDEFRAFLR